MYNKNNKSHGTISVKKETSAMKTASDYGFVKVAACSPRVAVANPDQNAGYVLEVEFVNTRNSGKIF